MQAVLRIALIQAVLMTTASCATILGTAETDDPPAEFKAALQPKEPYYLYIDGQPDFNRIPVAGGYYVWREGNTWHVKLVNILKPRTYPFEPVFSGKFHISNGYILRVVRQDFDPFDDVRHTTEDVVFKSEMKTNSKELIIDIQPLTSRYCVTFDLLINGALAPDHIYLGRTAYGPNVHPLTVCIR